MTCLVSAIFVESRIDFLPAHPFLADTRYSFWQLKADLCL